MAAIASITPPLAGGAFAAAISTLTSSDTITFDPTKKQLAVFRNVGGALLTVKIDGDGGTSVSVPGLGSVSVSGGLDIAVPAGESRAVVLSTISAYCQGVVTLTGASGLTLQIFNL